MRLEDADVERIARRVVELLRTEPATPLAAPEAAGPVRLVDAATLARRLGVRREWVYAHARQLGAVRLGGPRGRLRFDLQAALESNSEPAAAPRSAPRPEPRGSGLGFPDGTTYSRKGSTKSGRAALVRPRPDTGSRYPPMQSNRSAGGA